MMDNFHIKSPVHCTGLCRFYSKSIGLGGCVFLRLCLFRRFLLRILLFDLLNLFLVVLGTGDSDELFARVHLHHTHTLGGAGEGIDTGGRDYG